MKTTISPTSEEPTTASTDSYYAGEEYDYDDEEEDEDNDEDPSSILTNETYDESYDEDENG